MSGILNATTVGFLNKINSMAGVHIWSKKSLHSSTYIYIILYSNSCALNIHFVGVVEDYVHCTVVARSLTIL